MTIKFKEKWKWQAVGSNCWIDDTTARSLIEQGIAEEIADAQPPTPARASEAIPKPPKSESK